MLLDLDRKGAIEMQKIVGILIVLLVVIAVIFIIMRIDVLKEAFLNILSFD